MPGLLTTTQTKEPDVSAEVAASAGVGAADELSSLEKEVVAVFVEVVEVVGLPKSYGEIYGLLYASPAPLSFGDIHSKLGISKGSVSQGLRALRDIGAIKAVEVPDDRREFFRPETELRQLVSALLRETISPRLKGNAERFAQLPVLLGQSKLSASEKKILSSRLLKLQGWRRKAAKLLPWISKLFG